MCRGYIKNQISPEALQGGQVDKNTGLNYKLKHRTQITTQITTHITTQTSNNYSTEINKDKVQIETGFCVVLCVCVITFLNS